MRKKRQLKRNRVLWMTGAGVGTAAIAGALVWMFVAHQPAEVVQDPLGEFDYPAHIVGYSDNGSLSLYETKKGASVSSFDLKTLNEHQSVEVVEVQPTPKPTAKPKPTSSPKPISTPIQGMTSSGETVKAGGGVKNAQPVKSHLNPTTAPILGDAEQGESVKASDLYQGFVPVPVTIVKGDISWDLQKALTPDLDTAYMLELVKQLNKRKVLHPIYPGDQLTFLKEEGDNTLIGGSQPTTVPTPAPTKTPMVTVAPTPKPSASVKKPSAVTSAKAANKTTPTIKPSATPSVTARVTPEATPAQQTKTVTKTLEKASFVYYKDIDGGALYAYSVYDKEVYRITAKNGKLQIDTIVQNDKLGNGDALLVSNDTIILSIQNTSHIQMITPNGELHEYDLEGDPGAWVAHDQVLYYGYGDKLGKFDFLNGQHSNIVVGDETSELVWANHSLFMLNRFGKGLDNSILIQVNPETMQVVDLLEMKTKDSTILSDGSLDEVVVGRLEKEKDLTGKEVTVSRISSIDTKQLNILNSKWIMPFTTESLSFEHRLYMLMDHKVQAFSKNRMEADHEWALEGDHFTVLP